MLSASGFIDATQLAGLTRLIRSFCQSWAVTVFGLLQRSPGFAGLLAAQTISPLGDAMATTAPILHLQRTIGNATAVGLLLFVQAVAGARQDVNTLLRLGAADGWRAERGHPAGHQIEGRAEHGDDEERPRADRSAEQPAAERAGALHDGVAPAKRYWRLER